MTHTRTFACAAALSAAVLLSACGDSSGPASSGGSVPAVVPSDAPGITNPAPGVPPVGQSRAGQVYNVYITAPGTQDKVAFTVFEPATLTGGQTYPLVLHSHGFSSSRATSTQANPVTAMLSPGNDEIPTLIANGYGVISIDERGHGESGGQIRVMDPDFEGKDLLAMLDWAEAKLPWLRFGTSVDGSDAHNLVLGSIGGSYGGMYQFLIHDIDPRHRLDAMVPEIAPGDLTFSLFPQGTIKAGWDSILFLLGNTAGSGFDRAHYDPYVLNLFSTDLVTNQIAVDHLDFFRYHSNRYFCDGARVATNGGVGTSPERLPVAPGRIHAMFWQGMRDTLFNFNEAFANYQCYQRAGGDVRLLSYQSGHNSLQVVPDPGALLFQPPGDALKYQCGTLQKNAATMAFFDEHLKGVAGAASTVPTGVCLSLGGTDAVQVASVRSGKTGTPITLPATTIATGVLDVPVVSDLGITVAAPGDVIGGVPHLTVDIVDTLPVPVLDKDPIIFVGIGQQRANVPGVWDLVDNQLTPLRGYGTHDVDLVGVAERLAPGDKLALLFYGGHDQYHVTGSLNAASPTLTTVRVTGQVWLPLLGNLPNTGR